LTPNGRDITESSARKFADIIMNAKTVIWNGTMGVFEESENQQGTKIVAEAINNTPAFTVIGGGDTETALTEFNLESGIDYISTGGGAMLELLSKGTLPGFKVLV
jgi:phosphoglycerate kinase